MAARRRPCAWLLVLLAASCAKGPGDRVLQLEQELARAQSRGADLEQQLALLRAAAAAVPDIPAQEFPSAAQASPVLGGELLEARARILALESELAELEARRVERERQWLAFGQDLDRLGLDRVPTFAVEVPAEEREPPAPPAAASDSSAEREQQILRSLRGLLAVEGLRGLDLLECGKLGQGWIGPVVFRTLDERGRLSGSLFAERLRLEASRAARTLTLVLEDGYEAHGGERQPFAQSLDRPGAAAERRICLRDLDPMPWVEALPELLGSRPLDSVLDDGRWNKEVVRAALNQLLRQDASAGWLRVQSIEGIALGILRGVHVESFDSSGRLERRIFADRLRLERSRTRGERGVRLCFEDGAIERGGEKRPFLNGRWQVFLPRADAELFAAAGLPLATPEPTAEAAGSSERGVPGR
jgi:hypothetical protein